MSFRAMYRGTCADCEEPINPGAVVMYDSHDELVHIICPRRPDDVAMGELCPRCFCYHTGECI